MISRTMIAAGLILVFGAGAVEARDMRFPGTGDPAFVFQMPDNWTSRVDDDGNLILNGADHGEGFSLSFAKFDGALDDFASQVMGVAKGTLTGEKEPASISQFSGTAYRATMTNTGGTDLKLKFVLVRTDAENVAAYTEILLSDATPQQIEAADAVASSITLTAP